MALPTFSMRQLLEAGVHFGHRTRRWNPKMAPYLFGVRKDIHIIDLQQTVPLLHRAMVAVREIVAGGGRVLFVGTKRQASDQIAEAAKRCGQYYVNHRWLGGMMTNWRTISNSIKRLRDVEEQLTREDVGGLTKKEAIRLHRERDRLDRALGGIKEMGGLPDILFVIDTNRENIAVAEAIKIGIPVVGVVDSNSNPSGIDYLIPGNDDAIRAIHIYCELVAGAVLDGIQAEISASGGDVGEGDETPAEVLPAEEGVAVAKSKEQKPAEPVNGGAVSPEVEKAGAPTPKEPAAAEPAGGLSASAVEAMAADAEVPSADAAPPKEKATAEAATGDAVFPEAEEAAAPTPKEPAVAEPAGGLAASAVEAVIADAEVPATDGAPSEEKGAVAEAVPEGEPDKAGS